MSSQEEIVDVVDENNNVLYQISKQMAHEKGLLHRTVVCALVDSGGSWTLVEQSSGRQDPGQFVFPIGGHQRSGESDIEAVKREALEEVGLDGDLVIKHVDKIIYNREILGRKENHYFLFFEIHSDHIPVLNHEASSFKKFTRQELKQHLKEQPSKFGPPFIYLLENFYPELIS